MWYYIAVRTPLSNASGIGQYVYALGYANYKITEIGSNYIKGQAISGLMRDPEEIISGFQPRLLPLAVTTHQPLLTKPSHRQGWRGLRRVPGNSGRSFASRAGAGAATQERLERALRLNDGVSL